MVACRVHPAWLSWSEGTTRHRADKSERRPHAPGADEACVRGCARVLGAYQAPSTPRTTPCHNLLRRGALTGPRGTDGASWEPLCGWEEATRSRLAELFSACEGRAMCEEVKPRASAEFYLGYCLRGRRSAASAASGLLESSCAARVMP